MLVGDSLETAPAFASRGLAQYFRHPWGRPPYTYYSVHECSLVAKE